VKKQREIVRMKDPFPKNGKACQS